HHRLGHRQVGQAPKSRPYQSAPHPRRWRRHRQAGAPARGAVVIGQGEDDATGECIEQSRIKAGGNVIGKQDNSLHYNLSPRSQAYRTEEAGRAFYEAACGYRSQTKMPASTAALIILVALAGELFDIDSGLLAS